MKRTAKISGLLVIPLLASIFNSTPVHCDEISNAHGEGNAKWQPSALQAFAGDTASDSINPKAKIELPRIGGHLQLDLAAYKDDITTIDNRTGARRARLVISGKLANDWQYKLEYDFVRHKYDFVRHNLRDAYVRYSGLARGKLTFGQFKQHTTLENLISSKWTTFIERSLPIALTFKRTLGVGYDLSGDNYSFGVSMHGNEINSHDQGDDGLSISSRFTYAFVKAKNDVVHLGVSASFRDLDASNTLSFSVRPESRIGSGATLIGANIDAKNQRMVGLEAGIVKGRWSSQAEYIVANIDARFGKDATFTGYYWQTSVFLTGEYRSYSAANGLFDAPSHADRTWELALRLSNIDLSDSPFGGKIDSLTLGVNFYANKFLRFSVNLINTKVDDGFNGDETINSLQLRGQVVF